MDLLTKEFQKPRLCVVEGEPYFRLGLSNAHVKFLNAAVNQPR